MSSSGGSAAAGDAKATTKKAAGGDTDDGGSLLSVASIVRVALIAFAASAAWQIRMYAINDYGRVIHEFDPWFNFRATQYLADNGWDKFFTWFDHEVWYPLGRPVGTTIYPGMQITSVVLWDLLNWGGWEMSLNDVCAYVPVWGGVTATLLLGLLTYEVSGNANAGVAGSLIFSIIPAHIMRSVGGGYDNESVAMTCMLLTFWLWVRSLRAAHDRSPTRALIGGIVAGVAYFYMVATWGGYVFVINMIAVHAAVLGALAFLNILRAKDASAGLRLTKLHRAYSAFYIVGTFLAIRVPVVGMAPLKSLEQLAALGVFLVLQVAEACDWYRRNNPKAYNDKTAFINLCIKAYGACAALGVVVVMVVAPTGYFGPLSSRVRGLFVKHTRTGNPLVDSVAEHQPAGPNAYFQNLHYVSALAPMGFVMAFFNRSDAMYFAISFALVAYYFANKMARLIILIGPIASVLGGIAVAGIFEWCLRQLLPVLGGLFSSDKADKKGKNDKAGGDDSKANGGGDAAKGKEAPASAKGAKGAKGAKADKKAAKKEDKKSGDKGLVEQLGLTGLIESYEKATLLRQVFAVLFLFMLLSGSRSFNEYSQYMAQMMSNPTIMFKAQLRDGTTVMVDDYRQAYHWLRDNTPEDSRVMAWWDYGYQINGVANRTSIADGNTWNHEHIATLAKALTSPERKGYKMIRHLADYVLVWAGGGGDDLAKSPHLARIGNSVYHTICPGDPTCAKFGFVNGQPTKMMADSVLYRLHSHNAHRDDMGQPIPLANSSYWEEVYMSPYGKVRIYKVVKPSKASKKWVADPANWVCDAPGSWYCTGQYPPKLEKYLTKRKAFKQLEDFNVEDDEDAEAYQREYHARMGT